MVEKNEDIIDLRDIAKQIISKKKIFYIALPISFVLSILIIICVPRYYSTEARLAPELGNYATAGGTLGSLASTFGIDLSQMQSSDAITPLLYPDLMEDNGFVVGLLSIKVKSSDGVINMSYHDYLKSHQKKAWWFSCLGWVKNLFKPKEDMIIANVGRSPYYLSKDEDGIAMNARENITIDVDKKTGIISVSAKAQDPLICKILADSVVVRLQNFITDYRTRKARNDMEYYKKLTANAKHIYERSRQAYGSYADANTDVILQSFRAKQEDMENDMQLKYNAYTTLNTQLQAAIAKVQERTPAFTILKGANVPIKPSGPKRMLFVIGIMFMTALGCLVFAIKDKIISQVKTRND